MNTPIIICWETYYVVREILHRMPLTKHKVNIENRVREVGYSAASKKKDTNAW